MSLYFTGDLHGDFSDWRVSSMNRLNNGDVLICAGDFGFTWNEETKNTFGDIKHDYDIAFVRGNHDNVDILNSLPLVDKWGDKVGDFGNNTYWLLDGHMYTICGKKIFCFGGAKSIDKDWRLENEQLFNTPRTLWWEEEVPSNDAYELACKTLADNNYEFDYFVSHTCSQEYKHIMFNNLSKSRFIDPTESMISDLERLIRSNDGSWVCSFFGHFHDNYSYIDHHCLYDYVVDIDGKKVLKYLDDDQIFSEDTSNLPVPRTFARYDF